MSVLLLLTDGTAHRAFRERQAPVRMSPEDGDIKNEPRKLSPLSPDQELALRST
jgi:hypothetical protein